VQRNMASSNGETQADSSKKPGDRNQSGPPKTASKSMSAEYPSLP
jgi:hypothetical protein